MSQTIMALKAVEKSILSSLISIFFVLLISCAQAFEQPEEMTPKRLLETGYLPKSIIYVNTEQKPAHLILVEKASQRLFVLASNRVLTIRESFSCSTGMNTGNKERSGDRKTPEGVYLFTQRFPKRDLSSTYGVLAFPCDYPNLLDRLEKREGSSIWLHGTNKLLKPHDSNGCITMNNDDIQKVSRYIRLNHTPVIIKEKIEWVPVDRTSGERDRLLSFLGKWKYAFEQQDRALYLSCYKDQTIADTPLWHRWKLLCEKWGTDTRFFDLRLKDLFLLRQRNSVIALFDEQVRLSRDTMTTGRKKLFLARNSDNWKIIGETRHPSTQVPAAASRLTALAQLDRLRDETMAVTEFIQGWIRAWQAKDLRKYISYYASDFQSAGMTRKAWERHKGHLNELCGPIRITFEDLRTGHSQAGKTVTFRQTYSASGSDLWRSYKDTGTKTLVLKRVGKDWKIYRETWQEL